MSIDEEGKKGNNKEKGMGDGMDVWKGGEGDQESYQWVDSCLTSIFSTCISGFI